VKDIQITCFGRINGRPYFSSK